MALSDDLNRLAAQDVVYLTKNLGTMSEVFRGRVRQTLDGSWVFNASTGQNGVVGFNLGPVQEQWTSSDSPAAGITVNIPYPLYPPPSPQPPPPLFEYVILTAVIPAAFTE